MVMAAASGREAEAALDGVVTREADVEAELGNVGAVLRRLADIGGRARDVREDAIVQCRGARRSLQRLDLRLDTVSDLERPLALFDLEVDRHALHGDDLSDQLRQVRQRAAQLAGEGVEKRLLLLRRSLVVHVDDGPPVALEHVAGGVGKQHDAAAGDVDAIHGATVDVVRDYPVALPAVRIFPDPAGADHLAGADFEQASFQLIRHSLTSFYVDDLPIARFWAISKNDDLRECATPSLPRHGESRLGEAGSGDERPQRRTNARAGDVDDHGPPPSSDGERLYVIASAGL